MQPAVEFRNISKAFGAVQANADVSFSIAKGSIHGVIGENGAGKSTLMSILYGYYNADSGQLLINGEERQIRTSQEAISMGIGMVHQHFMLVENMTVLDNVMLGTEGGFKLAAKRKETEGVFVFRDNGAQFTPVKTGIAGDKYFEVLSGLKDGDQVITGPIASVRDLADGAEVKLEQNSDKKK